MPWGGAIKTTAVHGMYMSESVTETNMEDSVLTHSNHLPIGLYFTRIDFENSFHYFEIGKTDEPYQKRIGLYSSTQDLK